MRYRSFEASDLPRLLELALLFDTSPFSFDMKFRKLSDHYEPFFANEMLKQKGTVTIVAETANKVVGFVSIAPNPVASRALGKKTGTILLLVVDRKYRNQGIAKHLVASALRILADSHIQVVTVGTDLYNISALHVYESAGFRMQMAWHIYRMYAEAEHCTDELYDEIDLAESRFLGLFKKEFDRPVSLLRDPRLNVSVLRDVLFENLYRALVNGNVYALMWQEDYLKQPSAWINYQADRIALSTLSLERGIYRVLDVWGTKELRVKMIWDLAARLRDFKMLEYWVRADNIEQIRSAEDAGMKLSYSGISLHLHF